MSVDVRRLRVLTWNVHGCVGTRGFDPAAVLDVVRSLSPDIVGLQEIDSRAALPRGADVFERFRDGLGFSAIEARTIRSGGGDYGHMLLSRLPVETSEQLDLSVLGREPRAAIFCRLRLAGERISVVSTHLGLRRSERRRQLETILEHLNSGECTEGALVLGDFNEWRRMGVATRVFCPPFETAAALPSFPARRPMFALDRIWCRTPLRVLSARVCLRGRGLSDHLPVLAELAYGNRGEV